MLDMEFLLPSIPHTSESLFQSFSYPVYLPQVAILLLHASLSGNLLGWSILCLLPGFFNRLLLLIAILVKICGSQQIKVSPSMSDVLCLHERLLRQPARRQSKVYKVKLCAISRTPGYYANSSTNLERIHSREMQYLF